MDTKDQKKVTFCAVSLVNISQDLKESHPVISSICETLAKSLAGEIKEYPECRVHSVNNYHNSKVDEEIDAIVKEIKKDEDL